MIARTPRWSSALYAHVCTTKNNINAKNTHCPKFHRNLNVYHALLCSKVSEFSCVRQPASQLECASNSLDFFLLFLDIFFSVVFTLEIHSFGHKSSSNPSSLLLQHVVRKRITSHHMDFAVLFFFLKKNEENFLFPQADPNWFTINICAMHAHLSSISRHFFPKTRLIWLPSENIFTMADHSYTLTHRPISDKPTNLKCHYLLESQQNFHFLPWIRRINKPIINLDQ